jgi:hypothetical protein
VRDVRCLALTGAALLLSGCVSSMLAKSTVTAMFVFPVRRSVMLAVAAFGLAV